MLNERHQMLLEARGLDVELMRKLGIGNLGQLGHRLLDVLIEFDVFLRQVDFGTGNESCWLWTGGSRKGYGRYNTGQPAHRVSYQLFIGTIPHGLTIDHLCENKMCVNPLHLEPVSIIENNLRRWQRKPKTHCANGHLWIPENIRLVPRRNSNDMQNCRLCHNESERQRTISRRRRRLDVRLANVEVPS